MASQGPNPPTAITQLGDQSGGVGWSSPGSAAVEDGAFATYGFSGSGQLAKSLAPSGFGFTIPSGATITGVLVEVKGKGGVNSDQFFNDVQLRPGGTTTGNNNAAATFLTTTNTWYSFGGSSDLWGCTLTDTIINASNFGVRVRFKNTTSHTNTSVDSIRVTVYYTTGTDVPGSFTADLDIQKAISSSLSADMDVLRAMSGSVTADADIQKTIASSFTGDLDIRKAISTNFVADMDVRDTVASSFTADLDALRTMSGTLAADGLVRKSFAGAFTADLDARASVASNFTADLAVLGTVPASMTLDGVVRKAIGGTATGDMDVRKAIASVFSADLDAQADIAAQFTADMDVRKTLVASFFAAAWMQRVFQSAFSIDLWVVGPFSYGGGEGEAGTFEPGAGGGGVLAPRRYVTLVERFRVASPRPERFRVGQYESEEE